MIKCNLCPRNCGAVREQGKNGYCGVGNTLKVARAALHFWEEPCISGESGSGTVFFSGCSLRCMYCQNHRIASGEVGKEISVERLVEMFYELKEQGANNINLVTPGHYVPQIAEAIELANIDIPFVYNTGSYEKVESLRRLDGLIDIYLPDFKYADAEIAKRYSNAPDYFEVATAAIDEMVRQVRAKHGTAFGFIGADRVGCVDGVETADAEMCDDTAVGAEADSAEIMTHGVIVRHLLLPGYLENSKKAVEHIYKRYGDDVFISIMNQYTPCEGLFAGESAGVAVGDGVGADFGATARVDLDEPLRRKVTAKEYEKLVDFAIDIGVENGFTQEEGTAEESFIPPFDMSGV